MPSETCDFFLLIYLRFNLLVTHLWVEFQPTFLTSFSFIPLLYSTHQLNCFIQLSITPVSFHVSLILFMQTILIITPFLPLLDKLLLILKSSPWISLLSEALPQPELISPSFVPTDHLMFTVTYNIYHLAL